MLKKFFYFVVSVADKNLIPMLRWIKKAEKVCQKLSNYEKVRQSAPKADKV